MAVICRRFSFSLLLLIGVVLQGVPCAWAGELRPLYRGARAMAMGNAFTAVADDEQAVWTNPAGLAGNQKYSLYWWVSDVSLSRDVIGAYTNNTITNTSKLSGDTLNSTMGLNFYGQGQFSPTLLMGPLGVGLIADDQISVVSANRALPQIELGYQQTMGIQVAYGYTLGRKRPNSKGNELRMGVAGKMLWRRGGYNIVPLTDILGVSRDTLSQLSGNYTRGYGADLGFQGVRRVNKRWELFAGLAYTDIGGTSFANAETSHRIEQNLKTGLAAKYHYGPSHILMSFDYQYLNAVTDWRKKTHLGLEVKIPVFSAFLGVNQVYLTYGGSFDIWIMKVTAASYKEELGSYVYQKPERRYVLRVSMNLDI